MGLVIRDKKYLNRPLLRTLRKIKDIPHNDFERTDQGELTTPKEMADHLNSFYLEKVKKIQSTTPIDVSLARSYTERFVSGKDVGHLEFSLVSMLRWAEADRCSGN